VDPLAGSPWSAPDMVAGFAKSMPNADLIQFAGEELRRGGNERLLDLGCGAGRNAIPLAHLGWKVLGIDLSLPMLTAAARRAADARLSARLRVALAPMDQIPVLSGSCDFLVAHGIWNLARSGKEFRAALHEAARTARHSAALFVFTFSRHTLPAEVQPVPGEIFVFTQFSGSPQCFLTDEQLVSELDAVGFAPEPAVPLRELNRSPAGAIRSGNAPVIHQGAFRFRR
jgi:SAM-dependent methyltransferase